MHGVGMPVFIPPSEQILALMMAVEKASFSAAASELGITQSAVSHRIAKLEASLGTRLILRNARRLALTDAGESLLAAIKQPLAELAAAFDGFIDSKAVKPLTLQVESGFASAWLSPRLAEFLRENPAIQLKQFGVSNKGISEGTDVGVKWGSGHWPNLDAEPLMTVSYTPICSPQMLADGGLAAPDDLTRHHLLHDRKYVDWQGWLRQFGLRHPNLKQGHVVDDTYILIGMAIEGRGVALASPELLHREIGNGDLVTPFPEMRYTPDEAYYIVSRSKSGLTAQALAFVNWLRTQARSPGASSDDRKPRRTPFERR